MISLVIPTLVTLAFAPGTQDRYRPQGPTFELESSADCRDLIGELAQVFRYSSDATGIVYRVIPKGAEVRADFPNTGRSIALHCEGAVFSILRNEPAASDSGKAKDVDVTSGILPGAKNGEPRK